MSVAEHSTAWTEFTCLQCGHVQKVPRERISGTCVKCCGHYRVGEGPGSGPRSDYSLPTVAVRCLDCRTMISVAVEAKSCWCPACSKHLDLSDQVVARTACKNVQTLGTLTVERDARLVNSRSAVGSARLWGRFEGTLYVESVLEIGPAGGIRGVLRHVGTLRTMAGSEFALSEPLTLQSADLDGTVSADLIVAGTLILRRNCRFVGRVDAERLAVEDGAGISGTLRTRHGDWF